MTRKTRLLWAIPVVLLALAAAALLALPGFVASTTHRPAIEALASSLTGRQVRIGGKLSLSLLPAPEIIAERITITGPDHETIFARGLTLDLSLPALLHGTLRATSLTVDAPRIDFPWPLPGGPAAIAPPNWLAALHAQIAAGSISLGEARFTGVNADIFTGAQGAVTVSGTGSLAGTPIALDLALEPAQLSGATPLALNARSGNATLQLEGGLSTASVFKGTLILSAPKLAGTAHINADATGISASALAFTLAGGTVNGSASLAFASPVLIADLTAQQLDVSGLPGWALSPPPLPVRVTLAANGFLLAGQTYPSLDLAFSADHNRLELRDFTLGLPGGGALTGQGSLGGTLAGAIHLQTPDAAALLQTLGLGGAPAGWSTVNLSARLSGTPDSLLLDHLTGSLGGQPLSGSLVLGRNHAAGTLDFATLDLAALCRWLGQLPAAQKYSADGEIMAARGSYGALGFSRLLLDGQIGPGVTLRRLSASLDKGVAAGSLSLDTLNRINGAAGFLALPSAAPLAVLIPAPWQPPAALLAPRLNLAFTAQGPASALAISATGSLGDFSMTAAPLIDLATSSATGGFTLRHPSAIRALNIFGLNRGLAWPGPGSVAMRADFADAAGAIGLPDFVLSFGALTATGQLLERKAVIQGDIAADTLVLPPLGPGWAVPWGALAQAQGRIRLTANRVLLGGGPVLGRTAADLTLTPGNADLDLSQAEFAGGTLKGKISAATPANAAPALSLNFTAAHADAAQIALPENFPFTLPGGTLDASASLTASGFSPRVWAATLAGTASLTATQGRFTGFDLAAMAQALNKPNKRALAGAMADGATPFASLTLAGTLAAGNCTLTTASLTGPEGTAQATGTIDLADQALALTLNLAPNVTPAITLPSIVLGPWDAPRRYPRLGQALAWARVRPGQGQ